MDPWMPEGMLNTLDSAISEDGVPGDADRGAIVALIERAASQSEQSLGRPTEGLQIALIDVCASLAAREELDAVLAARAGSREAVILGIERAKQSFSGAATLYQLYSGEIEYVLEALRH